MRRGLSPRPVALSAEKNGKPGGPALAAAGKNAGKSEEPQPAGPAAPARFERAGQGGSRKTLWTIVYDKPCSGRKSRPERPGIQIISGGKHG